MSRSAAGGLRWVVFIQGALQFETTSLNSIRKLALPPLVGILVRNDVHPAEPLQARILAQPACAGRQRAGWTEHRSEHRTAGGTAPRAAAGVHPHPGSERTPPRLARRTHQMGVLQHVAEILAATPKVAQVATVVQDVFVQEFGARSCMVWIMEDSGAWYQPRAPTGCPRACGASCTCPRPTPSRLPHGAVPGPVAGPVRAWRASWIRSWRPGGPDLYYVPFENQLLLMGFAIIGLESRPDPGGGPELPHHPPAAGGRQHLQRLAVPGPGRAAGRPARARPRNWKRPTPPCGRRTGSAASSWPSPATSCAPPSPASWASPAW